jgi:serine/threonine protein phosphatase PrpC
MHYEAFAATDVGRKRAQNQDSLASLPQMGLFVVADGMGGHRGGEIASAISVKVIPEVVEKSMALPDWSPRAVVSEAIRRANRTIFDRAIQQPQLRGMGTTTTALLFKEDRLTIGHVGDSRCYFMRKGAIWQATRDHSLVAEKLRAGLITRAEARTDRLRNVITRSVGFEAEVNVEVYEMTVKAGDLFLVCSDGLSGLLDDEEILKAVDGHFFDAHDLKKAVVELIQGANSNGGDDNISAVLIEAVQDSNG